MKRTSLLLLPILLWIGLTSQARSEEFDPQPAPVIHSDAVHVSTALDHITVLEFSEPVTQTAAGSSAFTIEWRDNKVLIKPTKPGVSTDLFVWTGSRRFAYELDPPGEVKNMNFAVDHPATPRPVPEPSEDAMARIADMALTRALLGAEPVTSTGIKDQNHRVTVRVESVFQSRSGVYIRYAIKNLSDHPYRVLRPAVHQLAAPDSGISLVAIRKTQLESHRVKKLHVNQRTTLEVSSAESAAEDLRPGDETHGVIVLRQSFTAPTVLELAFPSAGDHHVSATFVY